MSGGRGWRDSGGYGRDGSGSARAVSAVQGRCRRRKGGAGGARAAPAAQGRRRHDGILVAGARSGGGCGGRGGTKACGGGGGGNGGWTPSPAFHEQPLEMEETPFFLK